MIKKLCIVLTFGVLFAATSAGQSQSAKVTFCQFVLPENIKQGHATFNVRYSFKLNGDGVPVEIKDLSRLSETILAARTVRACILSWRLPSGFGKSPVLAVFEWEHGRGWTELTIASREMSYSVTIDGERCPYPK